MTRGPTVSRAVATYCGLLQRHPWWFIVGAIVVTACIGLGALWLEKTADNRVFFGDRNPEFNAFRAHEATYGESNNVLLAVVPKSGDVFTAERIQLIHELTADLWRAPYATRVDSITNYQYSRGTAEEVRISDLVPDANNLGAGELEQIRELVVTDPLLMGLLVGPEGNAAGINVNFQLPSDSPRAIDEIMAYLQDLTDRAEREWPDIDLHMTGNVMIMSTFAEAGDLDLITLIPVMCLAVIAILLVLLRSIKAVIAAMLLALFATASALGFAGWNAIVLSAGSTPAPLILLTITLAYSVHILSKFLDDYRAGWSKEEAIANTVDFNLAPISLISATTAIGFFALNASDAPPFHDLGNIVGVGVIATFVFSFSFVPALLNVLSIRRPKAEARGTRVMKRLGRFVVFNRQVLFWSMLLVIGVLAAGISRIELNDDWVRYFDDRFEFRSDTETILQELTGIDVLEYSVPAPGEGQIFEPAYLETLDRFASWLREQPEVSNVNAITDVLRRVNQNLHEDRPEYYVLPGTVELAAQYFLLYEMSLPEGLGLNDRVNVDRSSTRVTVTVRHNGTNLPSRDLRDVDERISAWLEANGISAKGTGLSLMFANMSERNIRTMLLGTGVALLLISGVIVVALKNFKIGIASLVPNFVPALMSFGFWGYAIGEIGIAVSVVAAMTFGIVVDDTIHFLTRYLKGRRELGKSPEESIQYAFATVGKALTVTTLVLVCGFLILATSGFKVSGSIGLLTAITLAAALAADFLFLPALLLKFDNGKKFARDDAGQAVEALADSMRLLSLDRRMSAYFERVKDGHPVRGGAPGPDAVQLWSNDYLSLDGHPDIVRAQVMALADEQNTVCLLSDQLRSDSPHRHVERLMAEFMGAPDAVLCQSGWCANAGLIQTIADEKTPVYVDMYAHASLWEGARLAQAQIRPFRHNSPESLEQMIKRHGPGIVAVDSIYSANGNICPLQDIVDLAAKFECAIVVDESHALGAHGVWGEGLVSSLGLSSKVHYRTVSLSKAFVTRAGLVAGPTNVMNYFRQNSPPNIFSSTVVGHEIARLKATLDVVRSDGWRRTSLRKNTEYLRGQLHDLGWQIALEGSQVIPIPAGKEKRAIALRNAMESHGIFGAVFCYPATPSYGSLIRFSVNCGLSDEDLQRVVHACRAIRPQFEAMG